MKIVLGLGNPCVRYAATRHNVGFRVADSMARRGGVSFRNVIGRTSDSWVCETELAGRRLLLAKPRTFMNRSGMSVFGLCRSFALGPEDLIVVHDDADLPVGRVRIRRKGGAGGHRGVLSIIETLGTDRFTRIKLGVSGARRDGMELMEYVLEGFGPDERTVIDSAVETAADAVEHLVEHGLDSAMDAFNGIDVADRVDRW